MGLLKHSSDPVTLRPHEVPYWMVRLYNGVSREFFESFSERVQSFILRVGAQVTDSEDEGAEEVPCVCPACGACPAGHYGSGEARYDSGWLVNREDGRTTACSCVAGQVLARQGLVRLNDSEIAAAKELNLKSGMIRAATDYEIDSWVNRHGRPASVTVVSDLDEVPF